MIENLEFEEFYKSIRSEINDENTESLDDGYRVDRFTQLFINYLGDSGIITDATVCVLDKRLGRARVMSNGWALDEEEGRLSILIAEFRDSQSPENIHTSQITHAVSRAQRIYEFTKRIDLNLLEPSSKEYVMLRTIKDAIDSITQLRIYFLTDGRIRKTDPKNTTIGDMPVYIRYWDIQRLYRLVSSNREYEPIEIDFMEKFDQNITCLSMPSGTDEYRGYLAIIPGNILATLYEEYGPRLMELNVRSFLQQRGKVNRGIRNTILKEPHRFLAYNNGVSITAESIRTERLEGGELVLSGIGGLQIVNGGQTVASIHRAMKIDRCQHLDKIAVQAKISIVNTDVLEELIPKISRYSNTQNTVNEADFASNDPFHIAIERLSNSIWAPGEQTRWFYERARGQYAVSRNRIAGTSVARRRIFDKQTPKSQKFTKTDLAKYFNCWEQKPHIVSLGAQKNFTKFITFLATNKSENFEPDEGFYKELIAKAIVYKSAQKIARQHKFPSYRANAVAYTIALISYKTFGRVNLNEIWERQEVTSEFSKLIYDWMPTVRDAIIQSADQYNVTEWAKKVDCWQQIKSLNVSISTEFEKQLRAGDPLPTVGRAAKNGKAIKLTTLDRQNINRVIQRDANYWWNLGIWGRKSGALKDIQINVIRTIASYAADGWVKIPSAKQSFHAVQAMDIGNREGFNYQS